MFQRAHIVVRAAAVLVALPALVLAGCGGSEASDSGTTTGTTVTTTETAPPPTTETTTTTEPTQPPATVVRIRVVDGAPEGGIVREKIDQGDRVVLVVTSDVADEIHVHGYDVSRPVAAGGTTRLRFTATIPGRFEVELEERGVPIGELTVQP